MSLVSLALFPGSTVPRAKKAEPRNEAMYPYYAPCLGLYLTLGEKVNVQESYSVQLRAEFPRWNFEKLCPVM